MKHLLFFSGLFLILSASQCSKENQFDPGQSFSLKMGEIAQCSCGDMSVQFTAVTEDSRCPKFTNCIWQGQVTVQLSIQGDDPKVIELTLNSESSQLASTSHNGYNYRLLKMDPYPEAGKKMEDEDYVVELVVEE